VAGKWEFALSLNDGDSSSRCGYPTPDNNADHFRNKERYKFDVARRITLELREPNLVVDEDGNLGNWTMVYDEGFQVQLAGFTVSFVAPRCRGAHFACLLQYFAFSKYGPRPGTSLSSEDVSDYIRCVSLCSLDHAKSTLFCLQLLRPHDGWLVPRRQRAELGLLPGPQAEAAAVAAVAQAAQPEGAAGQLRRRGFVSPTCLLVAHLWC
jgi:hypothetical protein